MKYLPFYKKCVESGMMPAPGLCWSLQWDASIDLFRPKYKSYWHYWATDQGDESFEGDKRFNPLRQNIVLFMAAMNNEL